MSNHSYIRRARIAVLCSSGGGVLDGLCKIQQTKRWPFIITGVVTDRPCGAERVASDHDIRFEREMDDDEQWSMRVAQRLGQWKPDAVLLLMLRKVAAPIWRDLGIPVLNVHPSLLPAYAGLHALERNYSDAKLASDRGAEIKMGATIHLTNDRIDNGPIISQRYFTITDAPTIAQAQHICYLFKIALVLECVCKLVNGTLPNLRDIPTQWDWAANYITWEPFEPITDVLSRLAEPWAVEWLHRKAHEGAAQLARKALHA